MLLGAIAALAIALAVTGAMVVNPHSSRPHAAFAAPDPVPYPTAAAAPSPSSPTPSPSSPPRKELSPAERRRLTRAVADYLSDAPLAVSIRDLTTGAGFGYRDTEDFATASIVKVDILATLLLQAQRAGRSLTDTEKSAGTQMIEYSDNNAATALWDDIGGGSGLAEQNRRLGLQGTVPGPGGYWGSTETHTTDQLRLLEALTTNRSPLKAAARNYLLQLMAAVTPAQAWGVSAGAGTGDAVALKNGWLSRPRDGGAWAVNSIGRIHGAGHDYLIAVLSDHNATMSAGVERVEHVTRMVVSALAHA